jgi:hypothetical protein
MADQNEKKPETVKPDSLFMKRVKEKVEKRNERLQSPEKDERNRKMGLVK